ncbi:flavodoxin family protein [Clostridium sp. SHJSY1]|uniref:flavodoxin family protein n=1 Tax=Clostridium sp. SHJSY1 TaxID=2942483 RepID=UPI0028757EEB|nr:flavodoxin family protein [Clostridium sp. SHJSY1]MDS0524186.1 flavodoxin family protein [Clostridium sp. SHJSY1]
MSKKKVLGISFGRKMSNTEVMIKTALMECENVGTEVKFIRADDLNIQDCTGCIGCVVSLLHGGNGKCHLKDEMYIIDEALMECDAVIVGSPTYVLSPTGKFKTVCDRLGPSHDIAFRTEAKKKGIEMGKNPEQLPDERSFKPRVAALITVGGAMTQNWLSFAMPTMYEFTMSMGINVVDKYEYFGAMAHEHVVGNQEVMDRMVVMGQNIEDAINCETEEEMKKWRGADEGVCPVCHCDMLTIMHNKNQVECPVCGISGELTLGDGKIRINFSEVEQKRSRLFYDGKLEHQVEISTKAVGPGQIPNKQELLEKYKGYGE